MALKSASLAGVKILLQYQPQGDGPSIVLAQVEDERLVKTAAQRALVEAEARAQQSAQGPDRITAYAAALEVARLTELLNVLLA